jgi:hypothetical protein
VLTAVPPFALAVGRWVEPNRGWFRRVIPGFAMGIAIVATIVGTTWLPRYLDTHSARTLIAAANAMTPSRELFVHDVYPFSASFYSRGTARRADDAGSVDAVLSRPGALLIARLEGAGALLASPHLREVGRNPLAVLLEVVERP